MQKMEAKEENQAQRGVTVKKISQMAIVG